MSVYPSFPTAKIPDIVPIVLHQITKLRADGSLSDECFEQKLERLRREELHPRGLTVVIERLAGEHTRFVLQDRKGTLVEVIDCVAEGCHTIDIADEVDSESCGMR